LRRIAVLMGGDSQEREVSRVTGAAVARALEAQGNSVTLLDTHRGVVPLPAAGGAAAIGSAPPAIASMTALAARGPSGLSHLAGSLADVDCVFIALHGGWGEDGTIQAFFDLAGIPYTGSGVLGSALAMNKDRAKRVFRASGINTPDWAHIVVDGDVLPGRDDLDDLLKTLGEDLIVKPNAEGSTVGLSRVRNREELLAGIELAARYGGEVLVEKFVPGREMTIAILGDKALPIVEIIPDGGLYTYEAKYTKGKSKYVAPAELSKELTEDLQEAAETAFEVLGCEGFARVDFRLPPDGAWECLEVNTIPGMTPLSLVPMAAKAAGISFDELVRQIVDLAIERGARRAGSAPVAR
jgi:D-alanine-D-alanine ligase